MGSGFWVLGAGKKVERRKFFVLGRLLLEAGYFEGVVVVVRVASGRLVQ